MVAIFSDGALVYPEILDRINNQISGKRGEVTSRLDYIPTEIIRQQTLSGIFDDISVVALWHR